MIQEGRSSDDRATKGSIDLGIYKDCFSFNSILDACRANNDADNAENYCIHY
jgi:hypothetical protein